MKIYLKFLTLTVLIVIARETLSLPILPTDNFLTCKILIDKPACREQFFVFKETSPGIVKGSFLLYRPLSQRYKKRKFSTPVQFDFDSNSGELSNKRTSTGKWNKYKVLIEPEKQDSSYYCGTIVKSNGNRCEIECLPRDFIESFTNQSILEDFNVTELKSFKWP